MRSSASLLFLLAGLGLAAGCSKGPGNGSSGGTGGTQDAGQRDAGPAPCASDSDCATGEVCTARDGGSGFCGPRCQFDDLCPAGQRCDDSSGHCVAAAPCDDSQVSAVDACAESNTGISYCPDQGDLCRCTTPDGGDGAGVCRRVRALCASCTGDAQCNPCPDAASCDPSNSVLPAKCVELGDAGYCLRELSRVNCPFGTLPDIDAGVCRPSSGSCSGSSACRTDSDCQPGNYCDTRTGVCKANCAFDYNAGASVGCAPGQVCNVVPQDVLSDAGLARYGQGTCGVPCDQPGGVNCAALGAQVGLTFACVQERSGEHRCRPVSQPDGGGCMNDLECPRTTDGGPYAGYCSIYAFTCHYDCRDGIDPITGSPYSNHDCVPPPGSSASYTCENNQCVQKNCVQLGGAQTDGQLNQFCCGEDRDDAGYGPDGFANPDPANACPAGIDAGQYYDAPAPPWCHTGCKRGTVLTDAGYVTLDFTTCSVDAGIPDLDPLGSPSLCIEYSTSEPPDCLIAATSVTECPRGWLFASAPKDCQADNECQYVLADGGMSAGHCVLYPDGGGGFCGCDQDEVVDGGYLWGEQCPPQTRCESHRRCIFTRGCQPSKLACSAAP